MENNWINPEDTQEKTDEPETNFIKSIVNEQLLTRDIYKRDLTENELGLIRDNTNDIAREIGSNLSKNPDRATAFAAGLLEAQSMAVIHDIAIEIPDGLFSAPEIRSPVQGFVNSTPATNAAGGALVGGMIGGGMGFLLMGYPLVNALMGTAPTFSSSFTFGTLTAIATGVAALSTAIGGGIGLKSSYEKSAHEAAELGGEDALAKKMQMFKNLKQYIAQDSGAPGQKASEPDSLENAIEAEFRKLEQSNPDLVAETEAEFAAKRNTPVPAAPGTTSYDDRPELTPVERAKLEALRAEVDGTNATVAGKPSTRTRVETPDGEKDWAGTHAAEEVAADSERARR